MRIIGERFSLAFYVPFPSSFDDPRLFFIYFMFPFFVTVAPKIRPVPANGRLVVYQGEPATLSCDIIKGDPTPEITWKRKVSKSKIQQN